MIEDHRENAGERGGNERLRRCSPEHTKNSSKTAGAEKEEGQRRSAETKGV